MATVTMYDSTNPFDIPLTAEMVAGYVDGDFAWSDNGWRRFAGVESWAIAVSASTNAGNVLDVETGDATPAQAPAWVIMRRLAGVDPVIYVQASSWQIAQQAFYAAGISQPHWWIADYDAIAEIPPGAIAKQYIDPPGSGGHYDLSIVDATFGGGGGIIIGPTRRTTVIVAGSGTLHQFGRGNDNALYHRKTAAGAWGAWAKLGGTLTSDVISGGVDEAGVLRVSVVGAPLQAGNPGVIFDISSSDDGATWSPFSNSNGTVTGLLTIQGPGIPSAPAVSYIVSGTFTGDVKP